MPQDKIVIHGARPTRLVGFAHVARVENAPKCAFKIK